MGPPREHGGMELDAGRATDNYSVASMGPPREHGGMRNVLTAWRRAASRFNGAAA